MAVGDVVPMPTRPPLVTMRFVADDEPTTNCGAPEVRALPLMERRPQGVVEAMPVRPEFKMVNTTELDVVAVPAIEVVAR